MRVLLFPVGSAGDVHPFVAVGRRLTARGHHVTLVTAGHFAPLAERAGLDFVETLSADEYQDLAHNADLWRPIKAFKALFGDPRVGREVRRAHQLIRDQYVPGETVAVGGTLAFGPRVARDHLGVPLVTLHLQPAAFTSVERTAAYASGMKAWWPRWFKRLMFRLGDRWLIDPILSPAVNGFRAELGLPPVRHLLTEWIHSPDRVIGLFPDWYAPPAGDWPAQTRLTGFPLYDEHDVKPMSAEARAFLDAGPAPVVVTFGSAMRFAGPYFAAAAEALRSLGRRGIFLTAYREQVPADLPAGVAHFDYEPLSQLLPRAAALVHHGGIGTAAQGLAAGVPQIVMPLAHDQPDNADRLRRLGVGRELWPKRFTAGNLARELLALDTADVRKGCQTIRDRFQGVDPLEETCTLIEATAGQQAGGGAMAKPSRRCE